jgi:hypothetical protein
MNQPHNCDNFHHNYTILGTGWVQLIELWDKHPLGARGGTMKS